MILYTAAHGGFSGQAVPLGGGAAVCEQLVAEWTRTKPFPFCVLSPEILRPKAPGAKDLVHFGERAYADFSRAFEKACTEEILRHDPATTAVLANDVSEGPDFERLGQRGYAIFTIYHVDVVAYVADIYFKGRVKPETTVRWYNSVGSLLPDMAKLVWKKQEASVRYSRGLIVPSEGMRDVLLRCYPFSSKEKIHVLPWGSWAPLDSVDPEPLRREFDMPKTAQVLLALSRISPEKGQDLLLDALLEWESRPDYPQRPLIVFICGAPAFMQGERFMKTLQAKAAKLKKTRVIFPGYVTGDRKRAFFALADLYVFPSRHESYGLTLLEALSSGLAAVCLDHSGARSVMREEFGAIVQPRDLRSAIQRLLANDVLRHKMAQAARTYARNERFSDRAAQLARIISQSPVES
jgi:glycosyltransferase involved in cell wall biosynthesis